MKAAITKLENTAITLRNLARSTHHPDPFYSRLFLSLQEIQNWSNLTLIQFASAIKFASANHDEDLVAKIDEREIPEHDKIAVFLCKVCKADEQLMGFPKRISSADSLDLDFGTSSDDDSDSDDSDSKESDFWRWRYMGGWCKNSSCHELENIIGRTLPYENNEDDTISLLSNDSEEDAADAAATAREAATTVAAFTIKSGVLAFEVDSKFPYRNTQANAECLDAI